MSQATIIAGALLLVAQGADAEALRIDWLERLIEPPPVLSNLATIPKDLGLAGARLAIVDVNSTGRFTGHEYRLNETRVAPDQDFLAAAKATLAAGATVLVVKAPAADLLALADLPEARDALILNASAADDRLRGADCRANVLHTIPSLAMRADALSQFVRFKRWNKLALVTGPNPEDVAYAEALKTSLTKFGLSLSGEKAWAFDADMRRVASAEVPLFTQDLPDHDLLLVADARDDFGRYIAYNTWVSRPLAGSEGIVAKGWSPVVEHFGAAQLQGRFTAAAHRPMQAEDFAAWVAVNAIAEEVTRFKGQDAPAIRQNLLKPEYRLAGFLGTPLSFRDWDGQMRQPIPLVTERAVVALAPLEGFLHERSELDTLGQDRLDTSCTAFGATK